MCKVFTFKRPAKFRGSEKTREKIISLIKENKYITTEELADKTGLSIKGIEWNIQQLKAKKMLKRVGPDKGGYIDLPVMIIGNLNIKHAQKK